MGIAGPSPGWWQASDGNWYPPESHPNYRIPSSNPAANPSANPAANQGAGRGADRGSWRRPPLPYVVVVGAAVLAVVAFFAVSAIFATNGLDGIPAGPGTGTVVWHHPVSSDGSAVGTVLTLKDSPVQPFSGTIAGLALTGRATADTKTILKFLTSPVRPTPQHPVTLPLYHWTGTLGGTAFSLSVAEVIVTPLLETSKGDSIRVTGTFGSQPVRTTARVAGPTSTKAFSISGSLGNLSFTGRIAGPVLSHGASEETATFTLGR